jgi:DNA-binding NarL/FixJ family response regulator
MSHRELDGRRAVALRELAYALKEAEHERDEILKSRDEMVREAVADGMKQAEIARILGLTRSTVWQIVHDDR